MASAANQNFCLSNLRDRVAFECSQPPPSTDTNVTISDYNQIINTGYKELYGLLVTAYEQYNVVGYEADLNDPSQSPPENVILTDGHTVAYDLPTDCFKVTRVDLLTQQNSVEGAITLRNYMNNQRNQQNWAGNAWIYPFYNVKWMLLGQSQIEFSPRPAPAGFQILVSYVPYVPDMIDTVTITLQNIVAGDSVEIQGTAPGQNDVVFTAVSGFPTGHQFQVSDGLAGAATNLAAAINTSALWSTWGGPMSLQTQALANAVADGNIVTITLTSPQQLTWQSYTFPAAARPTPCPRILLTPWKSDNGQNTYTFQNYGIALNGFEEYVVIDAAMRIAQRQGRAMLMQDLMARKQAILARIQVEKTNRNAGMSYRITDITGGGTGSGGMGGGYGGFGWF